MPRRRQDQPVQAPNAQAYGQRGDQVAAQRAMPLPQTDPGPPDPGAGPAQPPSGGADPIAAALGFDPGIVPLTAGTMRPDEPVTAGLNAGAGPGPEALGGFMAPPRDKMAELLEYLADTTGDPGMVDLAQRMRDRV